MWCLTVARSSSLAESTSNRAADGILLTGAFKGSLCLWLRISQTEQGISTLKLKVGEEKNNGKL